MNSETKSATVWLADGVEEMEAVIILDILRRGNIDARGMALDSELEITASRDVRLLADMAWNDDWINTSDMLVVPGGMGGMEALRADARVLEHLRKAVSEDRFVTAVCAGPLVLAEAGVLEGHTATCYPSLESELKGAVHSTDAVVRDRNVITSQGPATAMAFAVELVRALSGDSVAKEIAQGLLMQ